MDEHSATVTEYVAASQDEDFARLAALRHPEWQMVWPQSGSR